MNLASDDRVVLEPGISGNGSRVQSGSQKASNFFHAIGIDSGFGKPEYLTTTIFEENAEGTVPRNETRNLSKPPMISR